MRIRKMTLLDDASFDRRDGAAVSPPARRRLSSWNFGMIGLIFELFCTAQPIVILCEFSNTSNYCL